jgi:hypothetical protein
LELRSQQKSYPSPIAIVTVTTAAAAMSEPGPDSIPTSADPRSRRPIKKRALTPVSKQSANIDALFAHPERPVQLPPTSKIRELAPPPEIVTNVQGSSAGAGSGEFHVYKASRRREYERVRLMDEEVVKEKGAQEWEKNREEAKAKDMKKTSKNQKKREKAKARKDKVKTNGPTNRSSQPSLLKKVLIKTLDGAAADHAVHAVQTDSSHPVVDVPGIIIHEDD